MTMKSLTLTILFFLALIFIPTVNAQSPDSDDATEPWMGEVTGVVINGTNGGGVPPDLEVTLYVWDDNLENKAIRDGLVDVDGAFRFTDVPFSPDYNYGVAVTYQDVTYFSEPAKVDSEQTELETKVSIYEVTSDASTVEITRSHIVFDLSPEGLVVSQIYIVSNNGDRTVWNALTLENGVAATLRFQLPDNASELALPEPQERWVRLPDGFVDVSPLLPGENASMIGVSYLLPFEDGMTFVYQADYPTQGVSFILPADGSLTLTGDGLSDLGTREVQDGVKLRLLGREGAAASEQVVVRLSGSLPLPAERPTAGGNREESRGLNAWQMAAPPKPALFAAAALGLALIVAGFWWWHFSNEDEEALAPSDPESILDQIAQIDDAYEQGRLSEVDYVFRREALLTQLRDHVASSS